MTGRLVLALLVAAPSLAGQTEAYGPLSLELPASTRTMAMGGAFQLTTPGSDAIFFNPSLLSENPQFGITTTTFDRQATFLTMSASTGWWGGGVGVGVQALSYTTDAATVQEIAEATLLTSGARAASELIATVGYSRSFGDVDWGVSAKTVEQRLALQNRSGRTEPRHGLGGGWLHLGFSQSGYGRSLLPEVGGRPI